MPKVTANGLDIHYERIGEGPRLLFISGTGGDLRVRPNMLDGPYALRAPPSPLTVRRREIETDFFLVGWSSFCFLLSQAGGWVSFYFRQGELG